MSAMIFIDNKYTRIYYSIISNAITRELPNEIYTENHHIIPKSLGGNNAPNNIVRLSAREHFICHLLLSKMTEGKNKSKMVLAAFMMASTSSSNQHRYRVTSRTYSYLRTLSIDERKGKSNPFKGEKITDTTRLTNLRKSVTLREEKYKSGELIRKAPYTRTEKHINDLKEKIKSRPQFTTLNMQFSNQTRANISKGRKGQPANNKGISPSRVTCVYCKTEVDIRNFSRYHKACA